MNFYYNSQIITHKVPFGAATTGEEVTFNFTAHDFSGDIFLLANGEYQMNRADDSTFSIKLSFDNIGLVFYCFKIVTETKTFYYGNNWDGLGGEGSFYENDPRYYQLTVTAKTATPSKLQNKIMYQIFPDSFCCQGKVKSPKKSALLQADWYNTPTYQKTVDGRINHWVFYGGNLNGITEKLDYLASLNVGIIYLNPIFKSSSPHRYNTSNFLEIDEMLGNEKDFKKLCREASKRGISIILDGVFSHVGADSMYFNKFGNFDNLGAFQSQDSPYYKWFRFTNYPHEYESWWGVGDLPNVDEMEESYRKFIYEDKDSVVRKWLRLGASGFRLDVADELPDEFIKGLRQAIKEENKDALLIGEVWEDASNKESYGVKREYFLGEELDGVMNYVFKDALQNFMLKRQDAFYTAKQILSIYENYPRENLKASMNLLSSHDSIRCLSLLSMENFDSLDEFDKEHYLISNYEDAKGRLMALYAVLYALAGIPSIYYGDEAGCQGLADPYNRGSYPWDKEDKELVDYFKKLGEIKNKLDFNDAYIENITYDSRLLLLKLTNTSHTLYIAVNSSYENIGFNLPCATAYEELLSSRHGTGAISAIILKDSAKLYLIEN